MRSFGGGSAWLGLLLVAASGLHFLGGNVADPDLWGHLRHGQIMLERSWLPREDIFSYSAAGLPWHNHEWLCEATFAAIYAAGGSAGLIGFKLLLCAAMVLAMYDAARVLSRRLAGAERPQPLTVALVLVAALAVISPGATFRPQLFTMLFLAVETALLLRGDERLRQGATLPWQLAAIPPILLVWANMHGGFLVGVGMLGVYGAMTWAHLVLYALRPRLLPLVPGITRRQGIVVAAVCLAGVAGPLVNPYGIGVYTFLFATLDLHGEISEWHPVALLSGEFLRFKLFVVATACGAALLAWRSRREGRPEALPLLAWQATFLALAAIYAVRHQRHTVLFGVVAAPLLVVAAEHARRLALERRPWLAPRRPVFVAAACGALVVAAVQLGGFAGQLRRDGLDIRYGRIDYPIDALGFLRAHGIEGNVAVPFEWGSYAIWKLAPESRVFIDGRFETVYPAKVIDDYFAFMHGSPGWERLLDDYPTDVVVVQRWRNIHPRLFARPDLAYVYSDPASLVFLRRTPSNQEALARLALLEDRTAFARQPTVFP